MEKEVKSKRLKDLEKELHRLDKADKYLEKEKAKLMKRKEKVRGKIRNEKDVLALRQKIKKIKKKKV